MSLPKHLYTWLITALIALLFYSVVAPHIWLPQHWSADQLANLLHSWLSLLGAYYLFNYCLHLAFRYYRSIKPYQLVLLLMGSSVLVFVLFVISDILYYQHYYGIKDLYTESTFYDFDIPIALLLLTMGSLYFYQRYYIAPLPQVSTITSPAAISVQKGKEEIRLPQEAIALLLIKQGTVRIYDYHGQVYLSEKALAHLADLLDQQHFFRANRQAIVARLAIGRTEKLDYQKLGIRLQEAIGFENQLVISKYNAPAFKKWLNQKD